MRTRSRAVSLHRVGYSRVLLLGIFGIMPLNTQAQSQAPAQKAAQPAGSASSAEKQGESGFQFSDAPAFSIAGVTDWTAAGGHGSDATLRTSEDLNREAIALDAHAATAVTAKNGNTSENVAAEARLRAAQAADPRGFRANRDLGMFYLEAAQYKQALDPLQIALQLHQGDAEDTYHLAVAYRGSGDFVRARQLVQDVIKNNDSADLHRLAGELDEALGKPVEAVQEEERATHLDPSEENYFTWGSELLLHRAIWQATQVFASGVKAHPASARLRTAWGTALFSAARYDEAAERLCEASALVPEAREPYLLMGKAALASPVPLPCVQSKLEQSLRLTPNDAEVSYYLAMVLLRQAIPPQPERAEMLLRRAVTLDSRYADANLQLGILAFKQGNYHEALTFFSAAAEANPLLGEAHYRMAVIYDRLGDAVRAKREFALHEQADAENAVRTEQQRREVKQFVVISPGSAAGAMAR